MNTEYQADPCKMPIHLNKTKKSMVRKTYGRNSRNNRPNQPTINVYNIHNSVVNHYYINAACSSNTSSGHSSSVDSFDKLKDGPNYNQPAIVEFSIRQESYSCFKSDTSESSVSCNKLFMDSANGYASSLEHSSRNFSTCKGRKKRMQVGMQYKSKKQQHLKKKKNIKTPFQVNNYFQKLANVTCRPERIQSATSSTPTIAHSIPSPNTGSDDISPIFNLENNPSNEDVFEVEKKQTDSTEQKKTSDMSLLIGAFDKIGLSASECEDKENFIPQTMKLSTVKSNCETPKTRKKSSISIEKMDQESTATKRMSCRLRNLSAKKIPLNKIRLSDGNKSVFLGFSTPETKTEKGVSFRTDGQKDTLSNGCVRFSEASQPNNEINHENLNSLKPKLSLQAGKQWRRSMLKFKQSKSELRKNTIGPDVIVQLLKDAKNIDNILNRTSRINSMDGSRMRHSTKESPKNFNFNTSDIFKTVSRRRKNEIPQCDNFDILEQIGEEDSCEVNKQFHSSKSDQLNEVSPQKQVELVTAKWESSENKNNSDNFYQSSELIINQVGSNDSQLLENHKASFKTKKSLGEVNLMSYNPGIENISQNEIILHEMDCVENQVCVENSKGKGVVQVVEPDLDDLDIFYETSLKKNESSGKNNMSVEAGKNNKPPYNSTGKSDHECDDNNFECDDEVEFTEESSASLSKSGSPETHSDHDYLDEHDMSSEEVARAVYSKPASPTSAQNEHDTDNTGEDSDEDCLSDEQTSFTSGEEHDDDSIKSKEESEESLGDIRSQLDSLSSGRDTDDDSDEEKKSNEESRRDISSEPVSPSLAQETQESDDDDSKTYKEKSSAESLGNISSELHSHSSGRETDDDSTVDDEESLGDISSEPHSPTQETDDEMPLLEFVSQLDEAEWGKLGVLSRCGLTSPLPFGEAFPDEILVNSRKLGEGVFSEVFMLQRPDGPTVVKIIPVEGDKLVNKAVQKKFYEILSELIITDELSSLRNKEDCFTSAFCELKNKFCLIGEYPESFLSMWETYDKEKRSDNDCPKLFESDQLYVALELAHCGIALEDFQFKTAEESFSVFLQTVLALAAAESSLDFEHRDLHIGNILLQHTDQCYIDFTLKNNSCSVKSLGIQATIIDFTLSRMSLKGMKPFYFDLAQDPEMFDGNAEDDYQFEVYRLMRNDVDNVWEKHEPRTNIRWLEYLIDKFINKFKYEKFRTKRHKAYINKLKNLKRRVSLFYSSHDLAECLMSSYKDSSEFIRR